VLEISSQKYYFEKEKLKVGEKNLIILLGKKAHCDFFTFFSFQFSQ